MRRPTEQLLFFNLYSILFMVPESTVRKTSCKHYPVIEQMKGILKEHGAVNALMSGSGPTVFGIFTDDQNAKEAYEAMQEAGLARQLFLTGFADGRGRED